MVEHPRKRRIKKEAKKGKYLYCYQFKVNERGYLVKLEGKTKYYICHSDKNYFYCKPKYASIMYNISKKEANARWTFGEMTAENLSLQTPAIYHDKFYHLPSYFIYSLDNLTFEEINSMMKESVKESVIDKLTLEAEKIIQKMVNEEERFMKRKLELQKQYNETIEEISSWKGKNE